MPLFPAFLASGLPSDPAEAAAAVGVPLSLFVPARDGAWQADFDLPRGSSWRLLPERGAALWIARDSAALPPTAVGLDPVRIGILEALLRLAATERVWLGEMAILESGAGWTPVVTGAAVLDLLAAHPNARGVAGVWSDERGQALHAEIYSDGWIWAETHQQAERWLSAVIDG